MSTIKQDIQTQLANIEAAYTTEKAKLEAELAAIGPLVEHEVESLKSWIQAAAHRIGL